MQQNQPPDLLLDPESADAPRLNRGWSLDCLRPENGVAQTLSGYPPVHSCR